MRISDLKNKKVLVLGLSTTGFAAAKFLLRAGARCFLSDSKELTDDNRQKAEILERCGARLEFGGHTDDFIKSAAFCILSPSIPPDSEILRVLADKKIPYFSDIEMAYLIKPDRTKIVAITGTNGKTTTTMLISHILNGKYCAPSAGNIGVSPLDYLCPSVSCLDKIKALADKEPDYMVIETSSYQLHYAKEFAPEIGVFCNLTPDHIAWHGGIENYFKDKAKMFFNMPENAHAILNLADERLKTLSLKATTHFFSLKPTNSKDDACIKDDKIYFDNEPVINIDMVPIVGNHNLENVMCAVIAAKIAGLSNDLIQEKIKSFKAPKHRCELILTRDGISYYNDSKATNPEASNVAIGAFKGKRTVLIAGGRDKNTPLDEFCALIKENIEKVVLIGEAAERFAGALKEADFNNIVFAPSLEAAIDMAEEEKPDVVLFSPACASFDMFKNYEMRGEAFREYVLSKAK